MNKRYLILIITIIVLLASTVALASSHVKLIVNGKESNAEVKVMNGTSYVPLREVANMLGADVNWDGPTSTITITAQGNTISQGKKTPKPVVTTNFEITLYGQDKEKTYLGKITSNIYDSDSIFNTYGTYGSKFSDKSIYNEFGTFGSKFSIYSPFNKFAANPPIVYLGNEVLGYLTINETIADAITPINLLEIIKELGY